MTTGKFPFIFIDKDYEDLKSNFEVGKYYLSNESENLTFELLDLIMHLLQKNYNSRLSLVDTLFHAFILNKVETQHNLDLQDIKDDYLSNFEIKLNINELYDIASLITDKSKLNINSNMFIKNHINASSRDNSSIYEEPLRSELSLIITTEYDFLHEETYESVDDGWNLIHVINKK